MTADPSAATTRTGLPRIALVLLTAAAGFIVLFGLREVGSLIGPFFLALNLMLVAAPLYSALVRVRVPRPLAALTAVLAVYAFLIAFVLALWWAIAVLIDEVPAYAAEFQTLYAQSLSALDRIGISETLLADQISSINPNQIVQVATEVARNVSSGVSIIGLVVTVVVFLAMDSITIRERVGLIAAEHPRVAQSLLSFGEGVRRYWVVTTVFGLVVAAIDLVALWIIGVPFAMVWAVLSFITNYIPNIGFLLGLIPPALVALLDRGVWPAVAVVIIYSVANFVLQGIIQPKYTGDAVGVTPTVSFLSLLLWTWVFGAVGALVALPSTLLVKTFLIDSDPRARWFNALVSSRPVAGERLRRPSEEAAEADLDPDWEPDPDTAITDAATPDPPLTPDTEPDPELTGETEADSGRG